MKYKIASIIGCIILFLLLCIATAYAEPANTYVYTSNAYSNSISVINPVTLQKVTDIPTASKPSDVFVNPAGTYIFAALEGQTSIGVYSTTTYGLITYIPLSASGGSIIRMAMDPTGRYLYATGSYNVFKIDMTNYTVVATLNLHAQFPTGNNLMWGIAYYNGNIYAVDYFNNSVEKLDTNLNIVEWYGLGHGGDYNGPFKNPVDIAVDSYDGRILVENNNATVTVITISNDTISGFLNMTRGGFGVSSLCVNSTGYVYRSDSTYGNVTIFGPSQSVGALLLNITGIPGAGGIVCNNYNNTIFVDSSTSNAVYIINNSTNLLGYVSVGNDPIRISIGVQAIAPSQLVQLQLTTLAYTIPLSGVNTTILDSGGNLIYTSLTDSGGYVNLYLNPTYTYTIWFQGSGINSTFNLIPSTTSFGFNVPFTTILANQFSSIMGSSAGNTSAWPIISPYSTLNITTGTGLFGSLITDTNYNAAGLPSSTMNYTLWGPANQSTNYTPLYIGSQIVGPTGQTFNASWTIPNAPGNSFLITMNETVGGAKVGSWNAATDYVGPQWLNGLLPLTWYWWIAFITTIIILGAGTAIRKGWICLAGTATAGIFNIAGFWSIYTPPFAMWLIIALALIYSVAMIYVEGDRYK